MSHPEIFFYTLSANDSPGKQTTIQDHTLLYLYSGELIIRDKEKTTILHAGECAFVRRDYNITLQPHLRGKELFRAVMMTFKRKLLRDLYHIYPHAQLPTKLKRPDENVIKLPPMTSLLTLFQSLSLHTSPDKLPASFVKLHLQRAVHALFETDEHFYPCLFDFILPWKIDILRFLEQNYMYDLTLPDIATYTGRSVSTLKRDFKKVSAHPPEKWIREKRLEVAYDAIRNQHRRVLEVYREVGFKNLSHFSQTFKLKYGHAPTKQPVDRKIIP
ncbi:MAG: AraC family transcriptional regulator [Prevotellaceae bacterium]|jgi:AraC-like DNA-binding protein|nr:AraC family transcriptional regulator [Prevotellaceae bacterium]